MTIKDQALTQLSLGSLSQSELQAFILFAQGKKERKHRGYYCDAFSSWESEGLIERKDRKIHLTKLGTLYLQDPMLFKAVRRYFKKQIVDLRKEKADLYRTIHYAKREIYDLSWDWDRLSSCGQETLTKITKILD